MSIRRSSIVPFAILCFVLSTCADAEERIAYRKHYAFPPKTELFFHPKMYRTGDNYYNVTYALCDDYEDLPTSERNCTVVQDTQPERSCPVTLKTNNNGQKGADYLEVFPFGSTRAVILWPDYSEPGSIKCSILDFATCKRKDVVLMEVSSGYSSVIVSTYFVAYDNSFELVTLAYSDGSNYHSKYHIDAEGNIISKFAPWHIPGLLVSSAADSFRAIVADSKPKAYLQFGYSGKYQISMLKLDGSSKLLTKFPYESFPLEWTAVSTTHETIGVAVSANRCIDVWLFDQEAKLKLNTSVNYPVHVPALALLNLADGGFILFTIGKQYKSERITNSWGLDVDTYYLTKVDANGKVVGTIKNEAEPNCQGKHRLGLGLQVFENDAKEYCVVVECSFYFEYLFMGLTSSAAQLDQLVKCFTDEDFTRSKTVLQDRCISPGTLNSK